MTFENEVLTFIDHIAMNLVQKNLGEVFENIEQINKNKKDLINLKNSARNGIERILQIFVEFEVNDSNRENFNKAKVLIAQMVQDFGLNEEFLKLVQVVLRK